METSLPTPARLLGSAGLIPFLGLTVGVWAGWPGAAPALAGYGATILAFLGAVHWGLALRAPASERHADRARFGLGVIPALLGWVALLLPLRLGLLLLALAILATAAVESLAARAGLLPESYLRLRWLLSLGAAASMIAGMMGI
ncbi:MAG TPA: DUF3429 domain-containing protein [Falsiroseomonas sp.]|jgi:hypothetical protein|nr:DUF3429 domain-containing protein [Falsiroseomonas sp.]